MFSPNCARLRSRFSWSKANKSFVSSSLSVAWFLFFFFSCREVANPVKFARGEEERRRKRCASLLRFGGWRLLPFERFQIGKEENALARPSASSNEEEEEDKKRAEREQERNESARREEEVVEERSERIIVETRPARRSVLEKQRFPILGGAKRCKFRVSPTRAREFPRAEQKKKSGKK